MLLVRCTPKFCRSNDTRSLDSIWIVVVPRAGCAKKLLPDISIPKGRIYNIPIRNSKSSICNRKCMQVNGSYLHIYVLQT